MILLKKISLIVSALIISFFTYAQNNIAVSGVILDTQSEPVIGAAVMEKIDGRQGNAAISDSEGRFSLSVSSESPVLEVSSIGFETQLVKVGRQRTITVVLVSDIQQLDGIVVIGYGTSRKSDLTGSVASLRTSQLEDDKSTSLTGLLASKVPGVMVASTGGAPGSMNSVIVRGSSSVSGGTAPLYVVDGVLMGGSNDEISAADRIGDEKLDPLSTINPDDIASIEVLKDASATAIYGSRGANGVVIVTTKSGQLNEPAKLTFSYSYSLDARPKLIDMLSGPEYETYMAERTGMNYVLEDNVEVLSKASAMWWNEDGTVKHRGVDHNWQKEILRPAGTHNANLSIRGGSKSTTYFISLGVLNKTGVVLNSSMDRYSIAAKVNTNVKKWLKAGIDIKGSFVENNGIVSAHDQITSNVFGQMLIYSPILGPEEIWDDLDDGTNPKHNPLSNVTQTVQNNKTNRLQGNMFLDFKITPDLHFKTSVGGYLNNTKTKNYYNSKYGPGYGTNGKITHATSSVTNILNENILTYHKKFKRWHNFNAMAGLTIERTTTDKLSITTTDILMESLKEESLSFGHIIGVPVNSLLETTLLSGLGRINYSYKNKYLLTASLRADGSSIFPEGNKFSYFPSVALAWKASEEKFLRNVPWIDLLKFRLSYGQTGNQRINALSSLALLASRYYCFNSSQGMETPVINSGMLPASIGNELLRWERTAQYNAGIDLNVFQGRLGLTLDAYYKDTRDLLITEQLPGVSGFDSAVRNIGRVSNRGVEFLLTSTNIEKRNFKWTSNLNISFNRNRVEEIGNGDRIAITPDGLVMDSYPDVFYVREGYPLGAMFGFRYDRLYQLSDFKEFYDDWGGFISDPAMQASIYKSCKRFTLRDGVIQSGSFDPAPGAIKAKKIADNTNPVNAAEDAVYLGSAEPLFFGGFANNFELGNWYMSLNCTFSYGNKLFNANGRLLEDRGNTNISRHYYENCWKIDRQDGTEPVYGDQSMKMTTDRQVEDASYFKIRNVVIGYNINNSFTRRLGISRLKVYVSADNLATFTKYSWYDPEHLHNNPLTSGLDRFSYPYTRTYIAGAVISF